MSALKTSIFKKVGGLRYHLEQRENSGKNNEFPANGMNYTKVFQQVEDYLNENVHPEVVTGAAVQEDGLLNDHGKEHVAMVIQRADLLLGDRKKDLKGFEIFLLLLAIHFHDVGNIYGRENHEERIPNVMDALGQTLPLDNASKRLIVEIVMSHGGTNEGSKDTIAALSETGHLHGIQIRPALIASILRYADEISDDNTRAARFLYRLVPPENRVFHDYSKCLQPAGVNGNTLILKFDIPHELAITESTKLDINDDAECRWCKIFLYDEILNRLKKCLCELEYCRKYSQGFISISSIHADIAVIQPNGYCDIHKESIRLRLSGYPEILKNDINEWLEVPLKVKNGMEMKEFVENLK